MMQRKKLLYIFLIISFCCKERLPTAGHSCENKHLYHSENINLSLWDSSFQSSMMRRPCEVQESKHRKH